MTVVGIDWGTLGHYLELDGATRRAMGVTAITAVFAQLFGVILGTISATMYLSKGRVLRFLSATYVWFIRGTPLIVQIFFIYYGTNIIFGTNVIPRTISLPAVTIEGAIVGGVAALAINEGAYMSEIIRASIQSVPAGQLEAAKAVGLRRFQAMRHVIWPQALRVLIPPLGNEFNNMLKSTSLLSFIGINELFNDAQIRYSATFQPVEYFLGVAIIYLALTTVWSLIQAQIEGRLNVAYAPTRPIDSRSWSTRLFRSSLP